MPECLATQEPPPPPILNLSDFEVEDILARCQRQGLVMKITGGRVVRWRHLLYEAWHVDKLDLAILAELLLRGPQTEGELRTRAGRMESFEDLDALRRTLRPLVERKLVVYLTPEDRRGAVLTHGFHDPSELERLKRHQAAQPIAAPPSAHTAALEAALSEFRDELSELKRSNADLQAEVHELRDELTRLKQSLGV